MEGVHLTSCCVQSSATSLTFEMLCFLMVYQDLQVVKVSLTVVAPRSSQGLLDIRKLALVLNHDGRFLTTLYTLRLEGEVEVRSRFCACVILIITLELLKSCIEKLRRRGNFEVH